MITNRLTAGHESDLPRLIEQLRSVEQPGSGLVRSTAMRDQKDPSKVYWATDGTVPVYPDGAAREVSRARSADRYSPNRRLLPAWMAVLIFTGRHSGTRYRVPIGIHDVQDIPTVFTDRPWRLNFREGAPVTVVQGGQQRHGNGVLVEGRENVGVALLDALQRTSRPSNLGLKVAKGHEPTVEDLAALGSSMIQIQYDTA
jgi:hypothetical protein